MSKDDDYVAIMLEEIRDQNKAVLEAVGQIQDKVKTLATKDGLDNVEVKVDTIQAVLTDTNKDLISLDSRVTTLEQTA